MAKKNTLLYLDEQIVRKAKELNLNLSDIAENALRERMFPMLSYGESVAIDFNNYIKTLEKEGRCYLLPFMIKKIHLKNIGIHDNLILSFDALNIVEGNYRDGKTTIVKSIVKTIGYESPNFHNLLSPGKKTYEINIEVGPIRKLSLTYGKHNNNGFIENRTTRCIVMDEPLSRLSISLKKEFLQYLMGLNTQIILTCAAIDMIEFPNEFSISKLSKDDKKE